MSMNIDQSRSQYAVSEIHDLTDYSALVQHSWSCGLKLLFWEGEEAHRLSDLRRRTFRSCRGRACCGRRARRCTLSWDRYPGVFRFRFSAAPGNPEDNKKNNSRENREVGLSHRRTAIAIRLVPRFIALSSAARGKPPEPDAKHGGNDQRDPTQTHRDIDASDRHLRVFEQARDVADRKDSEHDAGDTQSGLW